MPYERGGRADKDGNSFEYRYLVFQLMQILDEKIDYITWEPLGEDEKGIDIWIGKKNGTKEGQQCKGRNGSQEYWDFGTVNAQSIFKKWKHQLDRNKLYEVALVTPLPFTNLEDLIKRAKNTSDNPRDFYDIQILQSGIKFIEFFQSFCQVMEINPKKDIDLNKCIDYLTRIHVRQYPDAELQNNILDKIRFLLIGDVEDNYDRFLAWIIEEDNFGKVINLSILYEFLKNKDITIRDLVHDERILPRIIELNKEFKSTFIPLNNDLIVRDEFLFCRDSIMSGNSIIIHGKAGIGKSGCAENIIKFCEEQHILYIAIKLDKYIPNGTSEKWGGELGLPASVHHSIHSITRNDRAVIILDQLDALRWTRVYSSGALSVCTQIIDQVKNLNKERIYNISIVFICRTYDFDNDKNIKMLFRADDEQIKWERIQINEFNDNTVKGIVGAQYEKLPNKLRALLKIPANLYIWQHLELNKDYNNCFTTSHLVDIWWKQLLDKSFEFELDEKITDTRMKLIGEIEKTGLLYIPEFLMNYARPSLEFLSSNGLIVIKAKKICFVHQSILDSFLAESMVCRYYQNESIIQILGNKEEQTPSKRYQAQMMLQSIFELDSEKFLTAGKELLNSEQIRYSFKYLFFEILNQIDNLDANIEKFIIDNCEDDVYGNQIVNNVVFSRLHYVRLLMKYGLLEKWYGIPKKKDTVFNLLISIRPNYIDADVAFLETHAFRTKEEDEKLSNCFWSDINQDTDDLFELRMKFYGKYPQMVGSVYLDFKSMLEKCELRAIRLLALLLEHKIKNNASYFYKYEEELLCEDSEISINNCAQVIDLLLPYVPTENDFIFAYGDWSQRTFHKRSIERACIEIIKKANAALIGLNPDCFWKRYKKFMGMGLDLYNEIVLDGLYRLPKDYSDKVILYLCNNFDMNIFDKFSGNGDELLLAKKILEKHTQYCKYETFALLESKVLRYIPPDAKANYQRRIDYNREKNGDKTYRSFWGDFQKEILDVLPNDRLSHESIDLIGVLNRKFPKGTSLYKYSEVHSGWVHSPISEKKLSDKTWSGILVNKKLNRNRNCRSCWQEVDGGFVENSIEEFASSFRTAASEHPERMIKLALTHKENILNAYIDSLFSGVAYSEVLDSVPIELLEEMILSFSCDYTSYRANYICTLIEKRKYEKWSQKILNTLKDIAINHENPEINKPDVTNSDDQEIHSFDMIQSNALNCVRGSASRAIAHLLWCDSSLFEQFKDVIENLIIDENPAVKFASLFTLWPSYHIDRVWASDRIIGLYTDDYRLAGFNGTKNMLFMLYPKYREPILETIKKCYESDDKLLIIWGSHCLSEMFIINNEFSYVINEVALMNETQAVAILEMAINYFNKEDYNSRIKGIICKFIATTLNIDVPLSRLFYDNYIDLKRDKEFLIEIMRSNLSHKLVYAFIHYLEQESISLIDYKDIILSMGEHFVNNEKGRIGSEFWVEDDISKLITCLYDETCESQDSALKDVAIKCLDIWDLMFEKQIGSARKLSQEIMER